MKGPQLTTADFEDGKSSQEPKNVVVSRNWE